MTGLDFSPAHFTKGVDMDYQGSPDRVAPTLQTVFRHWEERRKAEVSRADQLGGRSLTIALAREAGTQGTDVAREVGTRLGWPVYDHELLERIAQDLGIRTRLLESVDEKRVGWLLEALGGLMPGPSASESAYVHGLVKTVLALGSHGECVIVGPGAAFILPAEATLRVRLVAPLKHRVASIAQRLGLSRDQAKCQTQALDRERDRFIRDHFFKDPTDPQNYDLVLNCARFGAVGCADVIVTAVERLPLHVRSEKQQTATRD
jgi:cytidylate kinase